MAQQAPQLRVPLRGELLVKLTQRFPTFDATVIDLLNTVRLVSQAINDRFAADLAGYQLTEGKFFVLACLFIEELFANADPCPSDIAEKLGITRATVTGLLDGLERAELIRRRRDPSDRRMITVSLTDRARGVLDELLPSLPLSMQPVISESLNTGERATLLALLTKLESRLEQESGKK